MSRITENQGLNLIMHAGIKWVRSAGVSWADVEPQEGERNWDALISNEQQWRTASENGLTPIIIVGSTPSWAQKFSGVSCGPIRPEKLTSFGDFMHDLVARYHQSPFHVKYWEIWNEPDIDRGITPPGSPWGCWGDQADPYYGGGYYAEMLKVVYPRIKAADPEAQVLVGGLLLDCDPQTPPKTSPGSDDYKDCSPSLFLEGILRNNGGDYFDAVSFHSYDYYYEEFGRYGNPNWHSDWSKKGPALISKSQYLRTLLAMYGFTDKALLNTESALLCGRTGQELICQDEAYALTKASYIAQLYSAARSQGLRTGIWYSVTGWRGSGLVGRDLEPSPAFDAFLFSASQLDNASYIGIVSNFPGVRGYEFYRDGNRLWVIWSSDGEEHTIQIPGATEAVYNVLGEPVPITQSLTITLKPIYIEWSSSPLND
jgi:hypothetical protein